MIFDVGNNLILDVVVVVDDFEFGEILEEVGLILEDLMFLSIFIVVLDFCVFGLENGFLDWNFYLGLGLVFFLEKVVVLLSFSEGSFLVSLMEGGNFLVVYFGGGIIDGVSLFVGMIE